MEIKMKFKKYIIISVLIGLLLFSAGAISASDNINEADSHIELNETDHCKENIILNSPENDYGISELSKSSIETDLNEIGQDSKKDIDYEFEMDSENYLIGDEWDAIHLKLPISINNYTITLDNNETIFNSNHGGIGIVGENITYKTIYLKNLNIKPGNHIFNLTYPGDDEYNSFSKAINFTCSFIEFSMTGEPYYPQMKFDFANNANGTVEIFIDNALFVNKTISQLFSKANSEPRYEPITTYTIYLDDISYANHTYKILYSNDERYVLDKPIEGEFTHAPLNDSNPNTAPSKSSNSKPKKQNSKIIAKKATFKSKTKIKRYTITLKTIKKVKVYLKIGKKTFKATTNNKGKATFKITKFTKKGTFKVKIIFKGNNYYKPTSNMAKIKIK
jgi:hypothetical protein